MQSLTFIQRVVRWRWAPCVGLVGGSLVFVVLAVALIPRELGPVGPGAAGLLGRADDRAHVDVGDTAGDVGASGGRLAGRAFAHSMLPSAAQREPSHGVVQSIFQSAPPMELPVAPPDPAPPPPPPEPPPPAPSSTIFTLPTPPEPPPPPQAPVIAPPAQGVISEPAPQPAPQAEPAQQSAGAEGQAQ
jgi:hypothetical protein